ncbi:MAG: hypothetical protein JWQ23_1639 [Herminiimonas sp.]|jgi:hypothetical protein|nr:hypothetical protein [Herminiimonas sp.]
METDKLKNALNRLHADLANTGSVDPELKDMLQVLDQDIHHLLGQETHEPPEAGGLAGRTQEISAKFAAEHPRLEPVLRELGAILERMGI